MKAFIELLRMLETKLSPRLRVFLLTGLQLGAALFILYLAIFHRVEPGWAAIEWNWMTGEMKADTTATWYITPPWVMAAAIDVRPQRVCITSSARSFNCRLVRFEPAAWKEFIATEGFRYYWFSNRISFNWGYNEEYRGMRDILRGYAFSSKKYQFITIVKEFESQ